MTWFQNAEDARDDHELPPLDHPTVDEQVAQVPAGRVDPILAPEIAEMLDSRVLWRIGQQLSDPR